jgi:hypothetical protein
VRSFEPHVRARESHPDPLGYDRRMAAIVVLFGLGMLTGIWSALAGKKRA